jgi:hypothetical protein
MHFVLYGKTGVTLKAKSSSGKSNNASKGVDENVWMVQPRGARGHEAIKQP